VLNDTFLLGQSGARVALEVVHGQRVVVKSTDIAGTPRLLMQAGLQARYAATRTTERVSIPEVLDVGKDSFTMAFVDGSPLGEYFLTASLKSARSVALNLLEWLDENLRRSVPQDHRLALQAKVRTVRRPAAPMAYGVPDIDGLFERITAALGHGILSPEGPTHGDLSFDNIIVERHSGRVVLIDFLDATVESPVLDIARLYLDARFAWWASYGRPRNRLLLAGRRLATDLEALLITHGVNRSYFEGCLALTILRILPYTQNPVRRGLLLDALHRSVPTVLEI
jgi:hypothetical protein